TTFTLGGPDAVSVVDREAVLVSGTGTYPPPHGFTPGLAPGGADLTGTYQWNATYSGDANNTPASDVGDPTERVTVGPDTPTLSTIPNQTKDRKSAVRGTGGHGSHGGRLQQNQQNNLHAVQDKQP